MDEVEPTALADELVSCNGEHSDDKGADCNGGNMDDDNPHFDSVDVVEAADEVLVPEGAVEAGDAVVAGQRRK